MDIQGLLNGETYEMPNPNYNTETKKLGASKFLQTTDPRYDVTQSILDNITRTPINEEIAMPYSAEQLAEYGITPTNVTKDITKELAEEQGFFDKAKNSFIQTISEGTLGTAKAFADLFDVVTLRELWDNTGYQNPVSAQIEEWQKNIRENIAPIYVNPDVNILNGGLLDSGFIFSGLPNVISSLTLLIPSKAVTFGLSKLGSYVTKQGIKTLRAAEKAHRTNQIIDAAETVNRVSTSAKINAFLEGNRGQNIKNLLDYGISGLTSRILENYQEARQTYDDSKPVMLEYLKQMSSKDKNDVINSLKNKFGEDATDWSNDESIANLVAQESATETFKDDMWNIFSDIYQMYAIGSVGRVVNGPSRAALRRLNRQNIKTIGMDDKAIEKILASRSKIQKAKDKVADLAFGAKHTILSEVSEGIEEAVNYIAQEEGFNYGKVLLNQEKDSDFWSERFIDYVKAPKLWDSAFWGLAGGVIFNAGAEYGNRFINAINTIQKAKEKAKTQVNDPSNPIKIPTFKEAFAETELGIRISNLEHNRQKFNNVKNKLEKINNDEDVFGITSDGKLKTEEERKVARQRALSEFRDEVILDAMDAGNFDLAKEYLASDEIKQFFVDNSIMSQDEANEAQRSILTKGDELKNAYDKQLRLIYNAISDWGERNDADLSNIPAEVLAVIARNNISRELENKYYQKRIDSLTKANQVLENDSKEELEKAARENGITNFKDIIEQIGRAHQLGMIRAEIADIKKKKQHLSSSGQAMLKSYQETEKMLVDEIVKHSTVSNTGINGEPIKNAAATVANILLSAQAAASVEVLPYKKGDKHTYQVNEGTKAYTDLQKAVQNRDRKLIKELAPSIAAILDANPSEETDADTFLNEVINISNAKNEIIKNIHDESGKIKILQNINAQLEANYREIAALKLNQLYNQTKLRTTKEQIQREANDILNLLNQGRAAALETASTLYQQLSKTYGKNEIKAELEANILNNTHTNLYNKFSNDERNAYDYITQLAKFNNAEQDIVLKDIYNALEENEIYEYSKDKDAVQIINDSIRKAKEKSTISQNQNEKSQNETSNNLSAEEEKTNSEEETTLNDEKIPIGEDEQVEGYVEGLTPKDDTKENIKTGTESTTKKPTDSSTGGQTELSRSDIYFALDNQIKILEQSNPTGVTRETLKEQTKEAIKPLLSNMDDATLDDLIETTLDSIDKKYQKEGESIESKLVKNIVKLSTISNNTKYEKVIQEANSILNRTFDKLLDNFNKHLSKGIVDGKYIIPLEGLLRYAKSVSNNEVEAQEIYNAFTSIIAKHPEKYTTIKGRVITETKMINNINASVETRRKEIETSIGGRTLNIKGLLSDINDEAVEKQVIEIVKSLKPGDKLYVRANYDKAKVKTKDPNGGFFVGGINFVVVDSEGHETLIAKAPTPMYPKDGNKDRYNAELEGWHYEIPLGKEMGTKEYPIQLFFKQIFISDLPEAEALRNALIEYEILSGEVARSNKGDEILDKAYKALEVFANKIKIDLNKFTQRTRRNKEGNRDRIRHLASLDIYTQDKWNLDVEDLNYETDSKDIDLRNTSYRESIDRWFNKMVESNEARRKITDAIENHGVELLDVGVEVETVGTPVLVKTKPNELLPATEAIADVHKDNIHLAAGDRTTRTHVVVSNEQPLNMNGIDTTGRSVVVIDTPNGHRDTINAYPVTANDKLFEHNTKLAAFKEAIEIRLFELMDEWFNYPNSEKLQAFLDMLGHKSAETSKLGGSLFAGFFRSVLPNGNGFSIKYKTDAEGNIMSPTNQEDGEVHYLTFYDTTPLLNNRSGKTSKARAAVQDYVEGREKNKAIVWNTNSTDPETVQGIEIMRTLIKKVLLDSLVIRIDPININADNDSNIDYGSFLSRDSEGNLAIRIPGIKKPSKRLEQYVQPNGDILITNIGRDGKAGNFSDFIIFNNLVNLNTRPIGGSNFTVFDNSEGDFGIQYKVTDGSPVGRIIVDPIVEKLSNIVKDIINKSKKNVNISKAIIKTILPRIADSDSSLYNLTKNSTILNKLLHKNVIFAGNLNGATQVDIKGKLILDDDNKPIIISNDAYAAYLADDLYLDINGKITKFDKGQILVGNKFMELLDGDIEDIKDALHHLLHENIHAFIADNDKINLELNTKYKKDIIDLWDEYSKKHPTSPWSNNNPSMDLEEFIVESLTNVTLIKELNNTRADEPLNNPNKPKSLLGKLFDKLLSWLSDLLVGPNGEKFNINKDSIFAKEYAIFEETLNNITEEESKPKVRARNLTKVGTKSTPKFVEGTLDFKETEAKSDNTEIPADDGIENFEIQFMHKPTISSTGGVIVQNDTRTKATRKGKRIKGSSIRMTFPTLRGALDNVDAETYFDTQEKINNGVISIKCN